MKRTILANGVEYDMLGFGTYKITGEFDPKKAVLDALKVGYRHVDTAVFYNNEQKIGEALQETLLNREDIFITTKLWTNVYSYEYAYDEINRCLCNLNVDYLDSVLIHWPHDNVKEVWTAMEDMYFDGRIRVLGVSNFKEHHVEEMKKYARVMPMINQIELHPEFRQFELCEYCRRNDILVEAWSPLMRGEALEIPLIKEIAKKYNATPAQVILAYDIKEGISVIPKSTRRERMEENFGALELTLSEEDVKLLRGLDKGVRRYRDPDNHGFGNQG